MKKTILYKTLFFCWTILALTGCDLDLQKNYDYEPSVDDPYVKVTAWEYFQDHKDMFSELIAAIEYTGLQVEPMFVLTMLKGETGLMTMSVWKNPWQAAVGKILVNQTGSNGKSPQRQAKTSNILPTNGVIHIFENYCKYSK